MESLIALSFLFSTSNCCDKWLLFTHFSLFLSFIFHSNLFICVLVLLTILLQLCTFLKVSKFYLICKLILSTEKNNNNKFLIRWFWNNTAQFQKNMPWKTKNQKLKTTRPEQLKRIQLKKKNLCTCKKIVVFMEKQHT